MKTPAAHPRRREGIALIIVMLVVFVLAAIAGGFAYNVKIETTLARNAQDDYEYEWLARSGMEYAKWVLGQQMGAIAEQQYDALNQFWAGRKFDTNDFFEGQTLQGIQLGRGEFSISITDLQSRFNINMANEEILNRAADLIGIDTADRPVIVDSILDWIDRDDRPRLNGVETEHYQSLDPPYLCKDGPMDDLSELLFVNGVTEDMYYGTPPELLNTAGMSRLERFRLKQADIPVYSNSFVNLFTTMGLPKINPNTASVDVFQLFGMDALQAQEIITYRSGYDGVEGTPDDTPFESPASLAAVLGGNAQQLNQFFSVRSAAFEVTVTVSIGGRSRQKVARLYRGSATDVRVLYSYWK